MCRAFNHFSSQWSYFILNNAGLGKVPHSTEWVRILEQHDQRQSKRDLYCTREVIGGMLEAGYGRIINLASTAGLVGYEYVSAIALRSMA